MQLNPALPQLFAESSADSRWFGHLILFAVGVGMVAFVIGRVQIIVRAHRGEKTVTVTDDGHGIDPNRLKYVLTRFTPRALSVEGPAWG
jgi:hypothetical protein